VETEGPDIDRDDALSPWHRQLALLSLPSLRGLYHILYAMSRSQCGPVPSRAPDLFKGSQERELATSGTRHVWTWPPVASEIGAIRTRLGAMAQQLGWRCERGSSRKLCALTVERDLWGNRAIVRRWGSMDGKQSGCVIRDPELSFDRMVREVHQRRRWHRYGQVVDPNGRSPE